MLKGGGLMSSTTLRDFMIVKIGVFNGPTEKMPL